MDLNNPPPSQYSGILVSVKRLTQFLKWLLFLVVLQFFGTASVYSSVLDLSQVSQRDIRISVIVNKDSYVISKDDIREATDLASTALKEQASTGYELFDIHQGHYGSTDPQEIFQSYLEDRLANLLDLPDYVIIFTRPLAIINGGFMFTPFGDKMEDLQGLLEHAPNYCNRVGSPYLPPGVIYGTAIDWDHIIAPCGYDIVDNNYQHVRDFSSGGECINQSGLECVNLDGEWLCPNLIEDPTFKPMIENRKLFVSQTINHELLHHFGYKGINDHSCSEDVPQEIKNRSAFNMCGTTIVSLQTASQRCVMDLRTGGDVCLTKKQCKDPLYCFEIMFGATLENQCSNLCENDTDCPAVLGKKVQCRARRLDLPTDKVCIYINNQ